MSCCCMCFTRCSCTALAHHQYAPSFLVHMTVLSMGLGALFLPAYHLHSSHQYEGICCACCTYGSGKVSVHILHVVLVCAKLAFSLRDSAYLFYIMCLTYTGKLLCIQVNRKKSQNCTVQYWPCCHVLCLTAFPAKYLDLPVLWCQWTCFCKRGTVSG